MALTRSVSWFLSATNDLEKAKKILDEDPDLAGFMAWQAARMAFKALEKRVGKRVSESSLVKLLEKFSEGKPVVGKVRDAALLLDHFKRLASHNDLFRESSLGLGPLRKEDGRRLVEAAQILINFLKHQID